MYIKPSAATLLGPFHGAIAVHSVTRCRCRRRCRGHRCAGGVRQRQWQHLVNGNVKRLAVANGPHIFQMLLVYTVNSISSVKKTKCLLITSVCNFECIMETSVGFNL